MAGAKGIEPSTSGVTGRRSNQAELRPQIVYVKKIELATFPHIMRDVLTKLNYAPDKFF
jgi:hypothetical protein